MKKFVLFVQPEVLRQSRFMEFYKHGFVVQWVRNVEEARKVMSNIFDVVIVDLNSEPAASRTLCGDLRRKCSGSRLVAIAAPAVPLPNVELDAVVPAGTGADTLVLRLSGLFSNPAFTPPAASGSPAPIRAS